MLVVKTKNEIKSNAGGPVGSSSGSPAPSSSPSGQVSTAAIAAMEAALKNPNLPSAKREELKRKLAGFYQKGKDSGLFDIVGGFLKDKLGLNQNTGGSYSGESYGTPDYSGSYPTEKKGLSTGAMIGIGVGAVAIIGLVVYLANKGKSK